MFFLPCRGFLVKGPTSIIPGSVAYTTPGTYTFQVPFYHTLTVDARGGGAGGAGNRWTGYYIYQSANGNASYFYAPDTTLFAGGGGSASGSNWSPPVGGVTGVGGGASGGDSNITGGGAPGGGGSVTGDEYMGQIYGGAGGYGGRAVRTWVQSQWYTKLAPRTNITVVVGAGSAASDCEPTNVHVFPTAGQNGAVYISWS